MSNDLFTVSLEYKEIGRAELQKNYDNFIQSVNQGTKAEGSAANASEKLSQSKQKLSRATKDVTSAQQRARQGFLATANSVAVLDGPLGGIASRFSAFGVLIGRIGIPLAAFSVGLSILTFAASKAVRQFAEWEVQTAKIEATLRATSNTFGVVTSDIEIFSSRLAVSTLETEASIRGAAQQLLTFRNISGAVFEDVLNSAADLAASGFGTMESATVQLAKALEDPRQGLTSLSRAGVTFTRQQRQLIISLIETGDRAKAMELILANVNRQVGGVAEAAARDTLAGDFDTIGQALSRATRGFGEFIGEIVRFASSPAAKLLAEYAAGAKTLEEQLADVDHQIKNGTNPQVQALTRAYEGQRQLVLALETDTRSSARDRNAADAELRRLSKELASARLLAESYEQINRLLLERTRLEGEIAKAQLDADLAQFRRTQESVSGLIEELNMRRQLIGLSEQEARNIRTLAEAEILNADINAIVAERVRLLVAQGATMRQALRATQQLRADLEAVTLAELNALSVREQMTRQAMRISESVAGENRLLERQAVLMRTGLTATVARRVAQVEQERAVIATVMAMNREAEAQARTNRNLAEAFRLRMANLELAISLADLDAKIANIKDVSPPKTPGGGGGGGTDPNADLQRELDELNKHLEKRREEIMIANGLERELVMAQYEERFQTLQMALDRRLLSEQEYADKVVQLTQSREDRIKAIEEASARSRMAFTAGILGDIAGAMQSGGDQMVKVAAGIAFAQGVINAHLAYTQALADPTIPNTLAKIGFAAKIFGLGMNAANAIRGAGGRGGGGGGARTASAPREAREATPQRVLIQGLDPVALYTGEQLQNLFDAFQSENNNRGQIFVVAR